MALADRIQNAPSRKPTGLPCSVGALLERLPQEDAKALEMMMGELGWSARRIYDELAAEGHEVGKQTIGRHRSGDCRCFKSGA